MFIISLEMFIFSLWGLTPIALSPLANAIIDRIAHDSYRINITSIDAEHDKSMREVYGLDKALRE